MGNALLNRKVYKMVPEFNCKLWYMLINAVWKFFFLCISDTCLCQNTVVVQRKSNRQTREQDANSVANFCDCWLAVSRVPVPDPETHRLQVRYRTPRRTGYRSGTGPRASPVRNGSASGSMLKIHCKWVVLTINNDNSQRKSLCCP